MCNMGGSTDYVTKNAGAAAFYGAVSISTVFINKTVLNVYSFQYTNFLLLAQHVFTILVLEILKFAKFVDYPTPQTDKFVSLLPVSLLYSLNVGIALSALSVLNIPMYGVLKRLATLFVLVGESWLMKKHSSFKLKQSVVVIVLGALIAGWGDLTFNLRAYGMALLSCMAQAGYLMYVAKSGAETGINSFGLLFYNSMLAIPFVFLCAMFTGELHEVIKYPHLGQPSFLWFLFINLALGSLLNYSMFLCTTVNSALTTTIDGHIKNAVSVVLGFLLLGGVPISAWNIVGLSINTLGGFWYSYIKYEEGKSKQAVGNSKMELESVQTKQ